MNIFTRKGLLKKLIIIIIAITVFSAIIPPKVSYAEDDVVTKIGGKLLSPIASLMIGIGDVIMNIIHGLIYDMNQSFILITNKSDGWGIVWTIVAAVVVAVAATVLAYYTAGYSLALLAKVGVAVAGGVKSMISTIVVFGINAGLVAGTLTALSWFGDNIVFPMYQISPEEIFKGEVALLDVNFFKEKEFKRELSINEEGWFGTILVAFQNYATETPCPDSCENIDELISCSGTVLFKQEEEFIGINENDWQYYQLLLDLQSCCMPDSPEEVLVLKTLYEKMQSQVYGPDNVQKLEKIIEKTNEKLYSEYRFYHINEMAAPTRKGGASSDGLFKYTYLEMTTRAKGYKEDGADENDFITTRIFFIRENRTQTRTEVINMASLGKTLKPTITKWYYAIRNFVLVVMMVILLYIGIRIILASVSSEKAKYKNMLMDWISAICLVFVMHYIMSFAMNLVDGITEIFNSLNNEARYVNDYEVNDTILEELNNKLKPQGMDVYKLVEEKDGTKWLWWDAKNMLGMVRIKTALTETGTIDYIGYGIVFLVLVFYTLFFLVTYIKRALYLTFFTIMAPLVAMTYPIDKLHDGKAQAFDMWLKEYVFNLMIQPVHLLLYTVLVSSAFELASTNILYTLVAIGFMMPAEKFVRKMFGFDKAQTPGFLGGAAGAALAMSAANKLFHRRPSKGGSMTDGGEKSSEKEDKINVKDDDSVDPILLAGQGNGNNISNVLSNKEKQRQKQLEEKEMKEAMARAQANKPGAINPFLSGKNKSLGFNTSENVSKKFEEQQKDLKKAQEEAKKEAVRKAKESAKKHRGRGLKAAAGKYVKAKLARTAKNIQNGKPIRDLARFTGGAYLGATGALLGATIGIASGDLKNVGGYGATLGAAGYSVGSKGIKSDPDIEVAYKEYERGQFESEEEYRKYLLEEQRKQYTNNDKYLEQLRTYLRLDNTESAREYMEEYGEFLDAGITDMEDFATAVKTVEDEGWSRKMAMTASKYYKKAGGKPKNMNKRDRENIEYQYRNIVRANGITDDKQVDKTVKTMLDNLDKYGSIKDKLTNV